MGQIHVDGSLGTAEAYAWVPAPALPVAPSPSYSILCALQWRGSLGVPGALGVPGGVEVVDWQARIVCAKFGLDWGNGGGDMSWGKV